MFGSLRRVSELGRGAHGVCYRAVDDTTSVEYCVKELTVDATAADVELRILTALPPHPNLVALLGSSRTDTHLLIQLELMHGSLDRLLARRPVFSEPEAFTLYYSKY